MTRTLCILLLFCFTSFSLPSEDPFCTCNENLGEPWQMATEREFYYADLIFTGKVIKIEHIEKGGYRRTGNSPVRYTFELEEVIKGIIRKETVAVYSTWTETSCGFLFEEGISYLVFSKRNLQFKEFTKEKYARTTRMCIGNTLRRRTEKKRLDLMRKLERGQ